MSESGERSGCEVLIARYGLTPDDEAGTYRGFICNVSAHEIDAPETFEHYKIWDDQSYRRVWVSEQENAIFTYCEGDFALQTHPDAASFERTLCAAIRFYREQS